jgi:hypothetical protein
MVFNGFRIPDDVSGGAALVAVVAAVLLWIWDRPPIDQPPSD